MHASACSTNSSCSRSSARLAGSGESRRATRGGEAEKRSASRPKRDVCRDIALSQRVPSRAPAPLGWTPYLPTYLPAASPPAAYPLPTYPKRAHPTLPYPPHVPNPA
eukprot:5447790-Prymnesium_polylepis.1